MPLLQQAGGGSDHLRRLDRRRSPRPSSATGQELPLLAATTLPVTMRRYSDGVHPGLRAIRGKVSLCLCSRRPAGLSAQAER